MSAWKIVLAIVVIVVIALIIWACYSSYIKSKYSNVEVHDVWLGGDPEESFNVLFLGDGFTGETELNTYRAAAYHLATALTGSEPFCHYEDRMNFFRIDVDDPNGEVTEGACPAGTPKVVPMYDMALPSGVPPVTGSAGVVDEDLEATHCWTESGTGSPLIVWLTAEGMKRAYALAELAPSVSMIVVIADAYDSYGGGHDEVWPGDVGLVVVSVTQLLDTATGEWLVDPNANSLFSHEFAHGMGLLDEYNYGSPPDPEFPTMRNVWNPKLSNPADPITAATDTIPWGRALASGCTVANMKACYGYLDSSGNVQPCSGIDTNCAYVTRGCQNRAMYCVDFPPCPGTSPAGCPSDIDPSLQLEVFDKCNDQAGAWEGGYYQPTGNYRSRRYCRMEDIIKGPDFCDACLIYLNDYLCVFGDKSTCPNWDVTKNPC